MTKQVLTKKATNIINQLPIDKLISIIVKTDLEAQLIKKSNNNIKYLLIEPDHKIRVLFTKYITEADYISLEDFKDEVNYLENLLKGGK